MPQPGWYPSPDDPAKLAFWDGAKWTGETMDKPSSAPALSRREIRLRRAEENEGAAMAFPTWEQRPEEPQAQPEPVHIPEATPIEAVAEVAGYTLGDGTVVEPVNPVAAPHPYIFDEPLPDDLAEALEEAAEPEPEVEVVLRPYVDIREEAAVGWSEDTVRVREAAAQMFQEQYPVPTESVTYPTVVEPVPTEAPQYPTVIEPVPTESPAIPTVAAPIVADESAWLQDDEPVVVVEGTDEDFDAVLGVKPAKEKRAKTPKTKTVKTKTPKEKVEPEAKEPSRSGVRSGLIVAAVGLVLALIGILLVPALLDPTPAGGPVQPGENRASAIVRELNVDVDGYCHPTVEVSAALGGFEVLGLKLHELNTACPVKVGEQVTVYYEPNSGQEARYVRAGTVPVDLIMWSLFGIGMLATAWGLLRAWGTRKQLSIPLVTPKG